MRHLRPLFLIGPQRLRSGCIGACESTAPGSAACDATQFLDQETYDDPDSYRSMTGKLELTDYFLLAD